MARPMRSSARASGRFSSREMVDCEHSSRSDGDTFERHLEHRIAAQADWRRCRPRSRRAIISSRKRMMSASVCVICSGARGSSMQAASRSATRSRCSISRNTRTPPSDDSRPPSNWATTVLPRNR